MYNFQIMNVALYPHFLKAFVKKCISRSTTFILLAFNELYFLNELTVIPLILNFSCLTSLKYILSTINLLTKHLFGKIQFLVN